MTLDLTSPPDVVASDDDQVGPPKPDRTCPESRRWGHSNLRFPAPAGPLKPDTTSFGVSNPDDVVMEVTPGFEYKGAFFTH
jgi:hypothetical protein